MVVPGPFSNLSTGGARGWGPAEEFLLLGAAESRVPRHRDGTGQRLRAAAARRRWERRGGCSFLQFNGLLPTELVAGNEVGGSGSTIPGSSFDGLVMFFLVGFDTLTFIRV